MNKLFLFIAFTFGVIQLSAQKWVEMIQDPNISFYQVQKEFNSYSQGKSPSEIPGFKQYKRWEYFMEQHIDRDGFFRNANASNDVYTSLNQTQGQAKAAAMAGYWQQIGPFDPPQGSGSGRSNCIAFHPTNSNNILIGTASGGIWRSTNGGTTWSSNTDGLENLGISDIQFSQSNPNVVYAATGDRDAGDTYSYGILKSVNSGLTWQPTGLQYSPSLKRRIYKIAVHPTNDSIVFAATSFGLRKSTDGGQTWIQIKAGSYRDIRFKIGDPNVMFAATAAIVIRSTNAGQTWTVQSIPFASSNSRLLLGLTAADPNYVYVIAVKSSDNSFGGIYLSTDGGTTFSVKATSPNILGRDASGNDNVGQGWYDLALGVSQTNKNVLAVGGVNVWRSIDGGNSWSLSGHWTGNSAPYVHADIHELKFSPHNGNHLWACTDGGLSVSTNNGGNWSEKNSGLSIAQMYKLGASATTASKVLTGWQDNGTNYYNTTWGKVIGGDGMECIIDYSNNNTMYGSLYYGNIRRSTNGGANWTGITDNISQQGAWVTPYVQDPNAPSTLYAGFNDVYKTTNKGNSWTSISNFSSSQPLNALAVAPSNSNYIYASNNYYIYKTTNGGSTWTDISNGTGSGNITSIEVHPTNPNRLWITKSAFYAGNKVFESTDGGTTWTNISGALPNLPANTIVYEKNSPDGLYVGLDVGVFYRDTVLGDWVPFMKNLPNVVVRELQFFYPENKIRAATFGRGLWESPVYKLATNLSKSNSNLESLLTYPNPNKGIVNIQLKNGHFSNAKLDVLDLSGRLIESTIISNTTIYKLNLKHYKKGFYILRIVNNNHTYSRKILFN